MTWLREVFRAFRFATVSQVPFTCDTFPRRATIRPAQRRTDTMQWLPLEDSPSDAELIGMLIRREWPHCQIRHVTNADEYRAALATGGFDLILSDYTLPG